MQPQVGTHGDHGTPRIVHALSQQILAETALLPFEHIGKGPERPLVGTRYRLAPSAVVEKDIDGLLEHPLLVSDDDLGGIQLLQAFQAVVAIDDTPVQVVQVGRRETAPVEGHEGSQVRRNDRKNGQDHPFRAITGLLEGLQDLQPLGQLFPFRLRGSLLQFRPEFGDHLVQVDLLEERPHRLRADARRECVWSEGLSQFGVLFLRQELHLFECRVLRVEDDPLLKIEHLLHFLERQVEDAADPAWEALEKPDVGDRRRQGYMPHALPPHLRLGDLHTALFAYNPTVLHPLVAAAQAFVIFNRPENLRAEEAVPFRFEGSVIYRLRFLHLSVRPREYLLGRGQRDLDGVETDRVFWFFEKTEYVFHSFYLLCF